MAYNHGYPQYGWDADRIKIKTWSGYPVILSNISSICYGTNEPAPEETTITNLLCDGDMEQYYESQCWQQADFGNITKPDGSTVEYTWDRLNTSLAPWPLSWSTWWANGDAMCGTGYHAVGKNAVIGTNIWAGQGKGAAAAIDQAFTWAGGTLHWRASARGKFTRILPPTPPGKAVVTISGDNGVYPLVAEEDLTVAWQTFSGSIYLPAGQYKIKLDSWNKETFLINTIDDGAVYFDDIMLSENALSGQACEMITVDLEGTPTPTLTTTPNPSATVDITSTLSYTTPTVGTRTPTATLNPEILYIWNCGFEAGSSNWGINQSSSVTLAGGPTGPQALRASGAWPSAWQTFSSKGDYTYLTAWVKGQATIRAVNTSTGAAITYYSSANYEWAWKKVSAAVYLPAGIWRLELNSTNPPGGEAFYDGVTLSYNAYATGSESWCAIEPTQGPTPFVTATVNPSPTTGPSSTPWPSPTQAIWWTPIASGTPQPSSTPNLAATSAWGTATAQGTPNSNALTATAWGTSTAQGTPLPTGGTGPSFQGTPGATPSYGSNGIGTGPGGLGGPCPKPNFWTDGVGTWTDAAVCEIKFFFSFSAGNIDQVAQFQAGLQKYEPFGTIREISDTSAAVRAIASSYNWSNTGLPGTHDSASAAITRFTSLPNSWLTGTGGFSLLGSGPTYSMHCSTGISNYVGPKIGPGMCWIFDILYQNGIMPIFQVVIDGTCLLALFMYINNNFLKPHS